MKRHHVVPTDQGKRNRKTRPRFFAAFAGGAGLVEADDLGWFEGAAVEGELVDIAIEVDIVPIDVGVGVVAGKPEGSGVVDVGEGDVAAIFGAELAIDIDLRRLLGEAFGDADDVVPFPVIDAITRADGIGEFGAEGDLEAGEAPADIRSTNLWARRPVYR